MENLNKHINQYLNYSYTINDGYILTEDGLSFYTIAEDISLCYSITYEQAIQYILKWLKETFGEYKLTYKNTNGLWYEWTYDSNGNQLTLKNSHGYWRERTYDHNGTVLTFKDSNGYWWERTYDEDGKELTYKRSDGYWTERTYDEDGKELTYNYGTSK